MDIPHIHILVQNEHTEAVARFERGLGSGIVRRAYGVVAVCLQQFYFSFVGKGVVYRAQNTVFVVYARAAQNNSFAVYAHTALCVAFQKAYAELFFAHVPAEGHAAGVKVRAFGAPQFCLGQGELDGDFAVRRHLFARNNLTAVQNFYFKLPAGVRYDVYAETGLRIVDCLDFYAAFQKHVRPGQNVQPYGAVYARARIPAAVGLVGIERLHPYLVFLTEFKEFIGLNIKARVAVCPLPRKLTVDIHLGVAVYAFELKNYIFIFPLFGNGKFLFVNIVVAFVPSRVFAARTVGRPLFVNHCVVGKRYVLPPLLVQMSVLPVFVKIQFTHSVPFCGRYAL